MKKANIYLPISALFFGLIFIDLYGVIGKSLGVYYSTPQLTVFRNLFALIPILGLAALTKQLSVLFKKVSSRLIYLCLLRGICFLSVQVFYFISIINMDFAIATTLSFSSPIFIILLSVILLRENVGIYRWTAVAIGFLGVILIMKPNSDIFNIYAIFPLICALSWAASTVILKFIPKDSSVLKINFYTLVFSVIGSIILLVSSSNYTYIQNNQHLSLLVLMGILGGLASILFIFAYRTTSPSILAPFEYIGIPSSILLGWIFFSEKPFGQLFPGALLIILAGLVIIWRENKLKP